MAKDDKKTQALNVVAEETTIDAERVSNIASGEASQVPNSRSQFTHLMLANANYFGTMPQTGLKAVEAMSGNTTYEDLRCIGLNPQQNKLEAVFDIKRQSGYAGNACSSGSTEYVRFFVERGGTWHDLGTATVNVHDLPGSPLPISYSVSIDMNELRRRCGTQQLVRVRGILSWNHEPTPGDPNFIPVWGNVRDVTVQIAPRRIFTLKDALEEELVSINPELLAALNLEQPLSVAEATAASYAQLKQQYAKSDVPPHRYGFDIAQKAAQQPLTSEMLLAKTAPPAAANLQPSAKLAISAAELAEIYQLIAAQSGNTTFEQLSCAGYNPQTNSVSAVISLKRSSGFSGGLCSPGSTEYVGFWVYYNHAWQWLGNAQVQVHDLTGIDEHHQVEYAVLRNVNMPAHVCANLEGLPMRAILSWNTPPTGPNYIPTWGNIVNTHVQPRIGDGGGEGIQLNFESLGGVLLRDIDNTTGRASVTGDYTCNLIGDRPFGGYVEITGFFTNAPNIFDPDSGHIVGGAHPLLYQVSYNKVGESPTLLNNHFRTEVTTAHGNQPPTADTYFEQPIGGNPPQPGITGPYYTWLGGSAQAVFHNKLAEWYTQGLTNGLYEINVQGYRWNGASYVGVPANHSSKKVYVYNGVPTPALEITSGSGDCGDVTVGDTLIGTYSVTTTQFFGYATVYVPVVTKNHVPQPVNPVELFVPTVPNNPQPNPVTYGSTAQAGTNGIAGEWRLSTAGMTACGYNVRMETYDRTIMNSIPCNWGNGNSTNVGFCLRTAGTSGNC